MGAAGLSAAFLLCGTAVVSAGAAQSMSPSEKEYNLSVEDLPDGVSKAYAKFHNVSFDADDYMLSLFDGYDAMIAMEEALTAAGEDLTVIEYQALEATVYERDEEGDYYPIDDMPGITLICALPENFAKNSGSVQITAVDGKGALCRIDSKIVTVGGEDCVMFDLSVFTTYAILYKQGGALTSGKQPTPTPVPKQNTPTPKPTKAPTPVPTKAAEKTPTPKPAAPEAVPTKAEVKTEQNTPTKAPSQTAGKTPTKAPAKTGSTSGTSTATAPVRDRTPQTGDSYSARPYFAMLAAGSVLTGLGVILWRRKK